jgi:hypothetical protein
MNNYDFKERYAKLCKEWREAKTSEEKAIINQKISFLKAYAHGYNYGFQLNIKQSDLDEAKRILKACEDEMEIALRKYYGKKE